MSCAFLFSISKTVLSEGGMTKIMMQQTCKGVTVLKVADRPSLKEVRPAHMSTNKKKARKRAVLFLAAVSVRVRVPNSQLGSLLSP